MDDVAFIAPDSETMQRVLQKVSELSRILGYRVNSRKTDIDHWTPRQYCFMHPLPFGYLSLCWQVAFTSLRSHQCR